MCGIVGTIRRDGSVAEELVEGLRVLEYRGYDSSGVAVARDGTVLVAKRAGRLDKLREALASGDLAGATAGIGHTRWATHGKPTDENAHPHTGSNGHLAVVHNGIFENYLELKAELIEAGVAFRSDTDTEVLAHMIERELEAGKSLADATRASLSRISGYYAVAVLSTDAQGAAHLVCARQGPPLALAVEPNATHLASDVLGLVSKTRDIIYLLDGDVAELEPGHVRVTDLAGHEVQRDVTHVDFDPEEVGKGTFEHFMLKEIHEQPDVLARTAFERMDEGAGDFDLGDGFADEHLKKVSRVQVTACGTALHAGWIARYLVEGLARVPVDVDFASEFRYREPVLSPDTMTLSISQSGETADTLAATRLARKLGARTTAICNVPGSTQVRESDAVIMTHAGPEIGVASTKAFTAQVVAVFMLAVRMGRARGTLSVARGRELLGELRHLRPKLESLLTEASVAEVRAIAERHRDQKGFLFLGRGINFPVALEGALKLKEISYMHAEGYPAGEMKHGPIALIDPGMTIITINSVGHVADKVRANIEQVKARGGVCVSVGSDPESHAISDQAIHVPRTSEWLSPILNTIPLQLLSYFVAHLRGCDIDKPRNLAKSVTVE